MQIVWNGLGSFVIEAKPADQVVTLVTNPYQNEVGLRFPRTLKASIVVTSHESEESNNIEAVEGEHHEKPFVVTHAGEFEVQGVFVIGIRAPLKGGAEHTIYRFEAEGINVGFLGALDRDLTETEVEQLGNIDVLIIPVGGGTVLNKTQAVEIVAQVEPRLVIPSYYEVSGLKMSLDGVDTFCKELSCPREDVTKLKITKSGLPIDEVKIAVLARA